MTRLSLLFCVALAGAVLLGVDLVSRAEPAASPSKKARKRPEVPPDAKERVPVAVARDRAEQMHATVESTLHSMHRHYFHRERATVPARALEDVFEDIARESKIDVRWISVNTKPMSIDHEPETDFEKRAAKEIASGKESFESVEEGTYRRAGAILLGAGCVGCHTTSFSPPSKVQKFAGLVISVPTTAE